MIPIAPSVRVIGRLAELLLRLNPMARDALRLTYSHLFMDEFQDTTQVQYDLVRAIFLGGDTIVTAAATTSNRSCVGRWRWTIRLPRSMRTSSRSVLRSAFAEAGISLRNEAGQAGAIMLQELLAEEASELIVCVLRLAMTARAGRHWTECQEALGSLRGIGPDDEVEQDCFAKELDVYATRLRRDYPTPPTDQSTARKLIDDVIGFIGRSRLVAAHQAYDQAIGLRRCLRQRRRTLPNRRRMRTTGPRRSILMRGFKRSR